LELKVLVSTMSAPASKYWRWKDSMRAGLGEGQEVVVALDVAWMVAEALAAESPHR
jgi:hypothetical protein